ncbi:uncharacterized protein LOC136041889 [Artemia franciscana]|uniref:uncharacterized protein LOC136041889 n=1 Tax=Artemia franciscana TaxID=6661 RepID=UPI0032DAFA7A
MTRKVISDHEESITNDSKKNPQKFWHYVTANNPSCQHTNRLKKSDGSSTTNPKEIADCMNASFYTNFTSKPPGITLPTMPPVIITQEDVFKILRNLNSNKAAGPDNLHPWLLIESNSHISLPLVRIFNMSLAKKSVPNDWRTANIIPIFKKGDKDSPGNYQPVSLTSAICKIMEGMINHALINYLEENTLISNRQHGFCRGRSIDSNFIQSYGHYLKLYCPAK